MPWNQPGGPGGDRDPWGSGGGRQGPPDLDEVIRKFQQRLNRLFGGGGRGNGAAAGGGMGKFGGGLIALIVLVLWLATGFYIVKEGEAGVVLRFGQYIETTSPGLHWRMPYPIETAEIVNVQKINTVEVGYRTQGRSARRTPVPLEALMLTRDENIVDIQFAVQYRVKDPRDLLFNVSDPVPFTVRSATESAVREVVGKNSFDFVITEGRAEIAAGTKELLQKILDRYQTGIQVITVEMQSAQAPAEVKAAFDDAVKAREDEERLKNEAEAYANDVVPRARGQAARLLQEAHGYKASIIARAQGEARRFEQILVQYRKAPEVTRERLYLEALEEVMQKAGKVVVDQKQGGNILYLPLDKIINRQPPPAETPASGVREEPAPRTGGRTGFRRGRLDLGRGRGQ